ncbi:hypothetical protein PTW37_15080 [Arthrobacter agilis]|uniref:hypothetical protein n=1 Tax=Arthrobacter agilis TaxID=37921 RepID=UPI002367063C|nr:hypothetical protein [Arthrobacter agilis]WDF33151.1 hypothetical protein PTW37_15080 [Arthrobacter agilis]
MMNPSTGTTTGRKPHFTLAASLAAASLSLTGCYSAAEEDWDAIAVGEDGVVGSVELRSFLLVAEDEGRPGRLLGTLNNESAEPVDITITDDDDEVRITVPADSQYPLDTNEVIFETVDDAPGARTSITATTPDGTEALSIPVVDGTLERYEPYLPN